MEGRKYNVGEIARIARVTVRTLHHYDAIGLLRPSGRSESGYREYGQAELERLQEIRFYRSIGMSLEAIGAVVHDPGYSRKEALLSVRKQLKRDIKRARQMLATINRTLVDVEAATTRDAGRMLAGDLFDGFDREEFEDEAEAEWGSTDQWVESQRTRAYGDLEWEAIKVEARAIVGLLAFHLEEGLPPHAAAVMDAAESHRQHIHRWFYHCTPAMHAAVSSLYTEDHRFRENYESVAPGLAAYVRAAVEANAKRLLASD